MPALYELSPIDIDMLFKLLTIWFSCILNVHVNKSVITLKFDRKEIYLEKWGEILIHKLGLKKKSSVTLKFDGRELSLARCL
jgi:hypothetical protein